MPIFGKVTPTIPLPGHLIDQMTELAKRQNNVFSDIVEGLRIGMSTTDVADLARRSASEHHVQFSFSDKLGFPDDISVCVNHEVINGIPKPSRVLKAGDVVKIAFGSHHALSAFSTQTWTVHIGAPRQALAGLLSDTRDCLLTVAERCIDGTLVSSIGRQIDEIIGGKGLYLSKVFAGHVIGAEPVIEPNIIDGRGFFGRDHALTKGTIISLLVLAHQAKPRLGVRNDNWTVQDKHCHMSACYSHMLRITSGRPQMLSASYPISVAG